VFLIFITFIYVFVDIGLKLCDGLAELTLSLQIEVYLPPLMQCVSGNFN
jgi:hypothetical protein